MSAEHFTSLLTADMRTAPDGRNVEYAESGTGQPRWSGGARGGWVTGYLYAHDALEIVSQSIRDSPMDGLTGDHPDKREGIAKIIDACRSAVRALALDAACDGTMTKECWAEALDEIEDALLMAKC